MKRVSYSEHVKKTRDPSKPDEPYKSTEYWFLERQGQALFHLWGSDCNADGTFTTAVIELEDGSIKNIPAEHIRFIN